MYHFQEDSYGIPAAPLLSSPSPTTTAAPQPSTTTSYLPPQPSTTTTFTTASTATTGPRTSVSSNLGNGDGLTTSASLYIQPTSEATSFDSEKFARIVSTSATTSASVEELPPITPTTYHPSLSTPAPLPVSNGHNGPDGVRTIVVRPNEPLEEVIEQKTDGMSQSINLRINVLVGEQARPVKASLVRDQPPGRTRSWPLPKKSVSSAASV